MAHKVPEPLELKKKCGRAINVKGQNLLYRWEKVWLSTPVIIIFEWLRLELLGLVMVRIEVEWSDLPGY